MKGKGGKGAMSEEKHMCEGQVPIGDGFFRKQCSRAGVRYEARRWWCNQHSPSAREERSAARHAAWNAEVEESKKRAAKLKEAQRRAECFPYMLAALKKVREDVNWMLNNRQCLNANMFDYLDAALAQAEEEA